MTNLLHLSNIYKKTYHGYSDNETMRIQSEIEIGLK